MVETNEEPDGSTEREKDTAESEDVIPPATEAESRYAQAYNQERKKGARR